MDPLQWTAASKPMHNINNNNHNSNINNSNGNDNNNNNKGRVLRFEFSNAMIESTMTFTEVHRYDDRKTYKEAWAQWLAHDEIAAMIKSEVARLRDLGYKGDVADKLFKSGRYYFRQKTYGPGNVVPRLVHKIKRVIHQHPDCKVGHKYAEQMHQSPVMHVHVRAFGKPVFPQNFHFFNEFIQCKTCYHNERIFQCTKHQTMMRLHWFLIFSLFYLCIMKIK
jgi:hypothetical protein